MSRISKRAVMALIQGLEENDTERNLSALPTLVEAMKTRDAKLRLAIVEAYKLIGSEALDHIATALDDDDEMVRETAIGLLETLDAENLPKIISALSTAKDAGRILAARALERTVEAVPALIEATRDSNDELRRLAIRHLGSLNAVEATPALLSCLEDKNVRIRKESIHSLGLLGIATDEVVSAMIRMTNDELRNVREASIWALGKIRPRPLNAIPVLANLLSDRHKAVRIRAAEALGRFGVKAAMAIPELTKAVQRKDPLLKSAVIVTFSGLGARAKDTVPVLLKDATNKSESVRWNVATALGKIGVKDRDVLSALKALKKDEDKVVADAARKAWNRLKKK